MSPGEKIRGAFTIQRIKASQLNSVIAYAASLMLTGVPAVVCESVLMEVFSSVKKSIDSFTR